MNDSDEVRLHHMLDAARDAIIFTTGRQRNELATDRMLTLSLVKCIEIIGEAAARVSDGTCGRYPEIPWQNIISMRHRLIHAYYDVNLDIVWQTVIEDLPPLIASLEKVLGLIAG